MISTRAKVGLEKLFPQWLEESLRTEAHPKWYIQPIEANGIGAKRFVMLTISSYAFRMIVILHFTSDAASIKYVSDCKKIASGDLSISTYNDYLSELGSMLCGAIKRGLFQSFPQLGMSSPNQLDCDSLKYVNSYPIDQAFHFKAKANDGTEFCSSLYISSIDEFDFDPVVIMKSEEKVEMGVLELF